MKKVYKSKAKRRASMIDKDGNYFPCKKRELVIYYKGYARRGAGGAL